MARRVIIVTLPINAWLIFSAFKPLSRPPRTLANLYERLEAFRIVNGYGLFRVMTKDRCEIVLEGSADGIDWLPYEFKWKPGEVKRAPGWCAPHQPRLDWQMWFAALGTPRENPWFVALIFRLLQGSHEVNGLLANNPFPHKPPRYIRAIFYRYRFTTVDELRQTGAWWKREELRRILANAFAGTVPLNRDADNFSRATRGQECLRHVCRDLERRALARIFTAQWRRKSRSSPKAP